MPLDVSLYEEGQQQDFQNTVLSGDWDAYKERATQLMANANSATLEELPNKPLVLCWGQCFSDFVQCLIDTRGGYMNVQYCKALYATCTSNCTNPE